MTDMVTVVTVRRLQRETSAVLDEVERERREVIVTRDGEEIARLVPLTPAERLWRAWVREAGGDPDDPHLRRPRHARTLPADSGPCLSDVLADLREQER
jgi:prevent-host-death family protein